MTSLSVADHRQAGHSTLSETREGPVSLGLRSSVRRQLACPVRRQLTWPVECIPAR